MLNEVRKCAATFPGERRNVLKATDAREYRPRYYSHFKMYLLAEG